MRFNFGHSWEQKEAIRETQKRMTGINNPNFKYLDTLIESLHENKIKTSQDAKKHFTECDDQRKRAKEVYSRLGGLRITDGRLELYASWRNMGFSQYAILTAADALSREGYKTPDDLNNTLERWQKRNLISDNKIEEYKQYSA